VQITNGIFWLEIYTKTNKRMLNNSIFETSYHLLLTLYSNENHYF